MLFRRIRKGLFGEQIKYKNMTIRWTSSLRQYFDYSSSSVLDVYIQNHVFIMSEKGTIV